MQDGLKRKIVVNLLSLNEKKKKKTSIGKDRKVKRKVERFINEDFLFLQSERESRTTEPLFRLPGHVSVSFAFPIRMPPTPHDKRRIVNSTKMAKVDSVRHK